MSTAGIALELSWSEMEQIVSVIARQVRGDGTPDVVVGVLRGGAVPAVLLAHRLDVREVRTIAVTRTAADVPHAAKLEPVVRFVDGLGDLAGLDVLLVDDVAGTAETADAAAAAVAARRPARLRRAVGVVNTENWTRPEIDPLTYFDYVGTACTGWVRFPWEAS